MIRFVDLTPFYWADEHPSSPRRRPRHTCSSGAGSPCNRPICAFIDTVTDRFIENDLGSHDFDCAEDVALLGPVLGPRCAGLIPDGFWERGKAEA